VGDLADEPLGRLLAVSLAAVIDDLHDRLAEGGWPRVRPLWGFVLLSLREQPRNIGEVGELMGVSKQAAAKVVASLIDAGLVDRDDHPTDGRASLIRLNAEGGRFLRDVETAYQAIEDTWVRAVGPRRMGAMRSVLSDAVRERYGPNLPPLRPVL
jgi:DNA-binding MarR family transcriptional regulator